jgi:hypothetical protein
VQAALDNIGHRQLAPIPAAILDLAMTYEFTFRNSSSSNTGDPLRPGH